MSDPIRLRDDAATSKAQKRLLRNEVPLDTGYDAEQGLVAFKAAIESGSAIRERSRVGAWASVRKVLRGAGVSSVWLWVALPAAATGLWAAQHATATRHDVNVALHRTASPAPAPRAVGAPRVAASPMNVPPEAAADPPGSVAAGVSASPPPSRKTLRDSQDSVLLAETAHMAELRRVSATDPARALAQADDGTRQFPRGFFAQEREAISITSLLRLGRTAEARARGQRFLSRHPQGPAAEQIRRAIGRE